MACIAARSSGDFQSPVQPLAFRRGSLRLRAPQVADAPALAELMIEAFRGTIDGEGETLETAVAEVRAYLGSERGGPPLLPVSRLAFVEARLVGACLASEWSVRRVPLIAYVMTHFEWKQRGVGKHVLGAVLQALRAQGHHEVRAVITEGNTASERLFDQMGFQRVVTS